MRETTADLEALQRLLDESDANAGEHLKSIFGGPNRMTATDLADKLGGIFEMNLACLTGDGSPVVAPIDAILLHGKVFFGVPAQAVRTKLLRRDQRVSMSYTDGSFGLIVHGVAVPVADDSVQGLEFEEVAKELYVALYGPGWLTFYEELKRKNAGKTGFAGYIEPRAMFAKR
ncbi:MAG: pyridoxamine 5'-phosphate oxidase family protein [Actinomycetota bacterium]